MSHLLNEEEMSIISLQRNLEKLVKVCPEDGFFFRKSMEKSITQPIVSSWIFLVSFF